MKNSNSQETSWGGVADWYDKLIEADPDSFQAKVILPNLINIFGETFQSPQRKKVLDLGCGQGFFSRALAHMGAQVTGADISPELIAIAQKRNQTDAKDTDINNITFIVSAAEEISHAKEIKNKFDVVLMVLCLQNMKDLSAVVEQLQKVTAEGGRVVVVLNHPAFRIPLGSSWGFDTTTNKQFRRIETYLSPINAKIDMTPGEKNKLNKKYTYSFHRPIGEYVNTFAQKEFGLVGMHEWVSHKISDSGPRAQAENISRNEIPLFMCLEFKKL